MAFFVVFEMSCLL